ncbi:MAG TPA: c-type cytochrome [Candidatus Acidoferrales bacterium]|nr:c-type cytochrome [Candidatus Acidoferrales bacterium]
MRGAHLICGSLALALLALAACDRAPGKPGPGPEVIAPSEVTDFETLYRQNCSGCHGEDGKGGAALALADPVYLAIVDDETLRRVASNGIPGTPMSAFARSSGGMLTTRQVDIIVSGIRSRWAKPNALQGATPPPYSAPAPGNAQHGAEVYSTFCASCHGPGGRGSAKGSSIVDGSFLALVPDQELRTLVIVGRPELGAPDWRGNVPGRPMSPQDISDVVAWLAAQRPAFPGQPYPNQQKTAGETR